MKTRSHLQKHRSFTEKKVKTVLTNGQLYTLPSSLLATTQGSTWVQYKLSNDFFSNRLWKAIDTPKVVLSLVRFDRKYLQKVVTK